MKTPRKKVLAISGSTRKNSSNECILQAISLMYEQELEVEIYNTIDQLPHFNPDLETTVVPQEVADFRQKIDQADGVLICTPEYVFSLPGSLKNALEWTVSTTIFSYKPFAFIIASASGEKAFESLDLVMSTLLQTKIRESSKLLIRGIKGKINQESIITDQLVKNQVREVMESLKQSIAEVGMIAENNR